MQRDRPFELMIAGVAIVVAVYLIGRAYQAEALADAAARMVEQARRRGWLADLNGTNETQARADCREAIKRGAEQVTRMKLGRE